MDSLPPELLDAIARNCEHADLKNLRLVNKELHEASTPFVFEHHYLALFRYSFDNLTNIARSSLAKHVRKLTVFTDTLPDWSREKWESKIDFRLPMNVLRREVGSTVGDAHLCQICYGSFGETYAHLTIYREGFPLNYKQHNRHCCTETQLESSWQVYSQLRSEQVAGLEESLQRIEECLDLLPNVEQACMNDAPSWRVWYNKWPVWRTLRAKMLVEPGDWMNDYRGPADLLSILGGMATLHLLEGIGLRAQHHGFKHITRLSIMTTYWFPYWLLTEGVDKNHLESERPSTIDPGYQAMIEGFRHLTDLRWYDPPMISPSRQTAKRMRAPITASFLRAATKLRRLDLTFDDFEDVDTRKECGDIVSLFDGAGEAVWPHLEHIALTTHLPTNTMLRFLQHHSSTLRSLELRNMFVSDVQDLLRQIPKIVKLDHVYVECLYQKFPEQYSSSYTSMLSSGTDCIHIKARYERAVKAYLLGESDELPELVDEGIIGEE